MKLSAVRKFFPGYLYSIIIAIAGFIFILMLANYGGIGISPDSVAYTSVAKSFAAHGTLHQYDDAPFVDFPIGYPVFLSVFFKIFGCDFVHLGTYINALLFGALIFLCGVAMQWFTHFSLPYKIAVLLCIAFSPGLLEVYSMLWSETVFILLSVLFMMAIYRYLQSITIKNLLIAAFIVAFICIVRYAGVAFIAAGGFVLLFMKHQSVKQKITHLILYGIISVLLLACNLLRNYHVEGFVTGQREQSITSLSANIYYFGTVLCNWLSLLSTNHTAVIIFGTTVILLLAVATAWHLITDTDKNSFGYIASVFALVYILFIIITASISRFETIDSRFISPAFVPLIFTLAYWLNKTVVGSKGNTKIVFVGMNIIVAALLISSEFKNSYASYNDIKDYGIPGYTDDDWRLSPTVQYIKSHPDMFEPGVEIYSNANDAVYFFTKKHAQQMPHKQIPEEINELLNEDAFYIVWFTLTDERDDVSLNYILKNRPMRLVKRLGDGAVYITKDSMP